ncbi:MAG: carbamoyltransferase HypF, partial [Eubacterium sp.]|nr:carbamoyltransferase HypF [Eubacterium sp.]
TKEEWVRCAGEADGFRIIESEKVKGDIFVSPDLAICDKCKSELFDPDDRRYLHPFINCTACGPRLTILDSMPYDRIRTSMAEFPMCGPCEAEYTDRTSRRYHAQPVCCPDCGPKLYAFAPGEAGAGERVLGDRDSIVEARDVIRNGGIVAVKGIGGFHLCCDARSNDTVMRLRKLKNRPFKPFAVMMRDLDCARRECVVEPGMEAVLDGPEKPIVIMKKRSGSFEAAAPDNPNLGVMLPYTPLHLLLFDYPDGKPMTDVLIMTSANPSGAPICKDDSDVLENLSEMCDLVLSHDRKIRLRADDSVMMWFRGMPYMIRRSRGYAPLPVMAGSGDRVTKPVLGVGGELKSTFCLAAGGLYYLSPYIADLSDIRSVDALRQGIDRLEELLEIKPETTVCDLHPGYNSSALARELDPGAVSVQHHYAHVLSCMAENGLDEKVIGVSFDGTGYGPDGTVWGGEFLIADRSGFERAGSIEPFDQAGGDLAPRQGWRIAAALLEDDPDAAEKLGICTKSEFNTVRAMIRAGVNTVKSTSAGRVFDAVSAVLGIARESTCEGEASMRLQFAAEKAAARSERKYISSPQVRCNDGMTVAETRAAVREIAAVSLKGAPAEELALDFHIYMSEMIDAVCSEIRMHYGVSKVCLTGGVMQNMLLLGLTADRLEKKGFTVYTHCMVPANDSGIALGQAYHIS